MIIKLSKNYWIVLKLSFFALYDTPDGRRDPIWSWLPPWSY